MDETRFDPRRRLCPDGSCIGVIGPNGLCKECGRPASGMAAVPPDPEGREAVSAGETDVSAGETAGEETGDGGNDQGQDGDSGFAAAGGGAPATGGFDAARRLCDDGSCVGVVGPDGVCRVCGRRAEG